MPKESSFTIGEAAKLDASSSEPKKKGTRRFNHLCLARHQTRSLEDTQHLSSETREIKRGRRLPQSTVGCFRNRYNNTTWLIRGLSVPSVKDEYKPSDWQKHFFNIYIFFIAGEDPFTFKSNRCYSLDSWCTAGNNYLGCDIKSNNVI